MNVMSPAASRPTDTVASCLAGGVFDPGIDSADDSAELRRLITAVGRRSSDTRSGRRRLTVDLDVALWRHLEDTGLSRLTSTPGLDAGPAESAMVLRSLAAHGTAVPVAETDLLACWLAAVAGLDLPEYGPLTVAVADAGDVTRIDGRISGVVADIPWGRAATVLLAVPCADNLLVTIVGHPKITPGHNLAGEPRDTLSFDLSTDDFVSADIAVLAELNRRGAWARCVQIIGALDAAAELTLHHTRDRTQFGRALNNFQSVQHALASMAGEIERGRAATALAVIAAAEAGFGSAEADYAVTAAKVTLGQVVGTVNTIAHQLHGAVGVTLEHDLSMHTMRAQSWIDEFGSTAQHAQRLGRVALRAGLTDSGIRDLLIGAAAKVWHPTEADRSA